MPTDFLNDMQARGQIHQVTDEPGLRSHLSNPASNPRRAYVGFDPTADSLTIGNLVPMMALVRFQRAGHTPIVVMGGGTGLIGDPSGKTAERQLQTREKVEANVDNIKRIFKPLFEAYDGKPNQMVMVNNIDWLEKISYLEALRDIGKHFSVNMMIQKESVKERLHNRDQGISYTEFSYMILQAYDYHHLHKAMGVTIQMGASDQWGNIVCGTDLIRRMHVEEFLQARLGPIFEHSAKLRELFPQLWQERSDAIERGDEAQAIKFQSEMEQLAAQQGIVTSFPQPADVGGRHAAFQPNSFGLTWPLITKADGGKFGKTESGAIWLTAPAGASDSHKCRTSPYAFYQFWLNAADEDVIKFLKTYSLIDIAEINALAEAHAKSPGERAAQRALARHMTEILHGPTERDRAESAARALFSGEIADLPEQTLREALSSAPSTQHDKTHLGSGVLLLDLLVTTKLAQSKREAKEFLTGGSVLVNGRKVGPDDKLTSADLLHGSMIALRRGKKNWHLTTWT